MMQSEAEALGRIVGRIIGLCGFPLVIVLIIGALRYFLSRPRISFRQAFLRWWVILIGALFFLLFLLGLIANAVHRKF